MPLLQSPPHRKFCNVVSACKVMATVFWDADRIVLTDYLEQGSTITSTYYTDQITKFWQHWSRRDEESCVAECCFTRTTHLLTHQLKNWLQSKMLDLNNFITHHIHQMWLQVTNICFLNWRNSWKESNLLTTKTLLAWQMAGWNSMFNNSSTMEKCWPKCISVAEDYIHTWQNIMYVSCY